MLPDRQSGVLTSTLQSHVLIGRAGLEPAMFTLWVPVLQTGAFTITLPAVINDHSVDNDNLPFPSPSFLKCIRQDSNLQGAFAPPASGAGVYSVPPRMLKYGRWESNP